MKAFHLIRSLLFFSIVLVAFLSCEDDEDSGSALSGEWSRSYDSRTCTITITSDNNFETDFIGDSSIDVWGSISISGNQITITDEGGPYQSSVNGLYSFQVVGNTVSFIEVNDPEEGRRVLIEGIWTKQ